MAIILFDFTSYFSLMEANKYIEELRKSCGWIPFVVAGNKIDSLDRVIS